MHGRPATDNNRIHAAAKPMNDLPRLRPGNPAALARASGNLAVQGHGPFCDDPRAAALDEFQIWGVELPGLLGQQAQLDLDAGRFQLGRSAACDLRERIRHGRHHAADACGQDGAGAGRGLAEMATRLQRHVHGRPRRTAARHAQGLDLGMIAAETPMPAFADDLGPTGDHAADHGIWLDETLAAGRQFECPSQVPEVQFLGVHGQAFGLAGIHVPRLNQPCERLCC